MFIDTHCHLTGEYFAPDELDDIIARARDAGVGTLVCPTADPADIPQAIEIINKYENVFATIGIHPEFAKSYLISHVSYLSTFLDSKKVIGIGEIGLDYHYGMEHKNAQIELFLCQLDIAKRANLPVAIHTRDAEADTLNILDGSVNGDVRGVMHCFSGTWDFAKIMLDRGFYFSAGGILTFKNADDLRETFSKIPTDRIVIETDAPLLAPVPYRGKQCEPFMVTETARVLAAIKNLQIDELETILEQNTKKLYPKLIVNK